MANKRIDEPTGVETVGHEWDGIEELNNPLPRWWIITWVLTILFSIGYMVVYPAWPLLSKGTEGIWGWSSRGQLAQETKAAEGARAETLAALAATPIEQIPNDPKLLAAAKAGGKAAFLVNCVQCHGSGAAGSIGYPNLNDDDWLWGGTADQIYHTVLHGIRFADDPETRVSEMPAFGDIIDATQIAQVSAYVASLSGAPVADQAMVEPGATVFADNCAACHGDDGKGNRDLGAPNLTDAIWLRGEGEAAVAAQVRSPRHGVMPAWGARLGDTKVKELAVYVHSLGGGE